MADEIRVIHNGDICRHFKNKLYQIVAIAYHSETKEKYVVYQALYGDFKTYIRPYDMFMSEVDHDKYPDVKQKYRFEIVNPDVELDESCIPHSNNQSDKKASSEVVSTASVDDVNPNLMEFLDIDTYKEKVEYLKRIQSKIDDKFISDVAASLDITVEDGNLDKRYLSLMSCLNTFARFECNRFR